MPRHIIMRSLLFLIVSSFGNLLSFPSHSDGNEKYVVYYSDKLPASAFADYNPLVLDSTYYPPLQGLQQSGKTILGYLSLGEVERRNPYFRILKQNNMLIKENRNWKGSFYIDMRNPLWEKMVIEVLIPDILKKGFNGIFFDTLDNPIELERSNPRKYAGMTDATIRLVKSIRAHYPAVKLMINRAYPILPDVAYDVDMVLGESVLGEYDFDSKEYVRVKPALYRQQVQWLQEVKRKNPNLKIYTLDYANPKNRKFISKIYDMQRVNGFIPYVTTVGLNRLTPEP